MGADVGASCGSSQKPPHRGRNTRPLPRTPHLPPTAPALHHHANARTTTRNRDRKVADDGDIAAEFTEDGENAENVAHAALCVISKTKREAPQLTCSAIFENAQGTKKPPGTRTGISWRQDSLRAPLRRLFSSGGICATRGDYIPAIPAQPRTIHGEQDWVSLRMVGPWKFRHALRLSPSPAPSRHERPRSYRLRGLRARRPVYSALLRASLRPEPAQRARRPSPPGIRNHHPQLQPRPRRASS